MDNFINMTIDEFLKLQEDIKKLKKYEEIIKEYDEMKAQKDIQKLKEHHKKMNEDNILDLLQKKNKCF